MKKRINIQMATVSALAVIITIIFAVMIFYNSLKEEVFDELKSYSEILSEDEEFYTNLINERDSSDYIWDKKSVRITYIQNDGKVIADSKADYKTMDNHLDREEVREAIKNGTGKMIRKSDTLGKSNFYYAQALENGHILRVSKESSSVLKLFMNIFPFMIIVVLVMVAVCTVVSHFFTRRILIPIEKMAENIDNIKYENAYPELIPFIDTIRKQHEDIIKNANMRQEFTANVSHELKTPLAAISGYAELIESGMAKGDDVTKFACDIHRNSDRLLTLINDILRLSELDEGNGNEETEDIDLYDISLTCAEMLAISAVKNNIVINVEGQKGCIVKANKQMMEELVYNLCDNGIRYNNPGGSVTISVMNEENNVILKVSDTGIGISEENQQRIFERFFRVDKSRSKAKGGTGLGLAIVKHIVSSYDAHLSIKSEEGQGTVIKIVFNNCK